MADAQDPLKASKAYDEFLSGQVKVLQSLDFSPETVVWHYTKGAALQSIIETGTIYATQVSCLNDSSEMRYASGLFKRALLALVPKYANNPVVESFLQKYLGLIEDTPDMPTHAPSKFMVACFTELEDDLTQWNGYCKGENGYAIGFRLKGLFYNDGNSLVVRVNYDQALHEKVAAEVAEATVRFYLEGLPSNPAEVETWKDSFFVNWDTRITRLAPMIKDPSFAAEKEFRIIRELQVSDLASMKFVQRDTMMSRHLPLRRQFGEQKFPMLPIERIIVGPCRHREITRISVDTLMRQMGYGTGHVTASKRPLIPST